MALQKVAVGDDGGSAGKGRPKLGGIQNTPPKMDAPPTLAEAGIDKNLAKRARSYATVATEQFEQLLTDKRQSKNRRVVLEGEASTRNGRLARLVAELRRRIASLIGEIGALKAGERRWKERALAAGWSERSA